MFGLDLDLSKEDRISQTVLLLSPDGFVGSAIKRNLGSVTSVVTLSRKDFDFRDTKVLIARIRDIDPSVVINAAGRVAGIQGNIDHPVDLIMLNAEITTSVLRASHEVGVARLIQFASACVYPLNELTPSRPEDIGTGLIEQTSLSYATAKIFAIEAVRSYRKEFNHDWLTLIPTNLYGPGDWDHGSGGHVISMLMEKFIFARDQHSEAVSVWGDGKSTRNFLHVDDLASAVQFLVKQESNNESVINVSGDQEITIKDLAFLMRDIVGYDREVQFDESKPNGARRKQLDDSYLRAKGWRPSVALEVGLRDYLERFVKRSQPNSI